MKELIIIITTLIAISSVSQTKSTYISNDNIVEKSKEYITENEYLKAAKELEKINPNDSSYTTFLTSISYYYLLAKDYEKAIEICDKGLESSISRYYFFLNKSAALSQIKKRKRIY